jgi:hypothetical protein
MKVIASPAPELKSELLAVGAKVFWWGRAEEALTNLPRFVAQVMTYGDWEDVSLTLRVLGEEVFATVLDTPPPGVFDEKSWNYWHLWFGRISVPPLPVRKL